MFTPRGSAGRRSPQGRRSSFSGFPSVLFRHRANGEKALAASEPEFFLDLHLDQIVAAITTGKEEYDLKPFYYLPSGNVEDVTFRQEVMQALEHPRLFEDIRGFTASLRTMRQNLAQAESLRNELQKRRWFLDAVTLYCEAVVRLGKDLDRAEPTARGLLRFKDYLNQYLASGEFRSFHEQTQRLRADLLAIRYSVFIDGLRVQVRPYHDECDYGAEVAATFEQFKQGTGKEYGFDFADSAEMDPVEAAILDRVVQLHPETFSKLDRYVTVHKNFADPAIVAFDREIQFYVAYLEYLAPFREAKLDFCYPHVTRTCKEVFDYKGFDLALAHRLLREKSVPVCNDFHLESSERIIVVSGPNQGGKTTFARTFGQLHYLASLGFPVPGTKAQLFLFDTILTHFEKGEDIVHARGKLENDLLRIHDILGRVTPDSIVILNEIFNSTTIRDASVLSRRIMKRIARLDLLCVWVTFLDELASLSDTTISMVGTVVPANPAQRTYKIMRQAPNGLAYALSIAEKYSLTYVRLKDRLRP